MSKQHGLCVEVMGRDGVETNKRRNERAERNEVVE